MSITLSNLTMSRVSAGSSGSVPAATDPYWSSVSLLTETTGVNGANNRVFLDSSVNNFTITNSGSPTQGTFSPFANGGGSGYFDGSGDLLMVPSSIAFSFGTGSLTIECWVYMTSYGSANQNIIDMRGSTGGADNNIAIYLENVSGTGTKQLRAYSGTADIAATSNNFALNSWTHIAVTRNGASGATKFFVNGIQVGSTATVSTNFNNTGGVYVGAYSGNIANFYGYVSNLRIVKGTAIYTGNFTPPTSPVTAITGTSLLLNFANAGIYDAAKKNNMYTFADAQVSTAETKFGTTSMLFSNVGDYVTMPGGSQFGFGTGDFTIEFWTFLNGSRTYATWIDFRTQTTQDVPLIWNNGGTLTYWVGSSARITSSMFGNGAWTHVAVSRASGSTKMFVDGVQVGSTFADSTNYVTAPSGPIIGEGQSHSSLTSLNGYIQDLRITKGVGRYTANFTPPTAAFPTN